MINKAISKFVNFRHSLILSLLYKNRGGMTGVELIAQSNGKLSRATVYVWLSELEDQGLIKAVADPVTAPEGGLPCRRYSLSTAGLNLMYHNNVNP